MCVHWFPQWTAVSYSRWIERSIHLCFRTPRARFPRTRLLSRAPVVISTLPGDLGSLNVSEFGER